jgi:RNA polymerase sigma-70 factor (ECF subfamily)
LQTSIDWNVLNSNSEKQLVEAAQKGCIESFGALYEHYYSSMAALAYSVLSDRQLAEDAAQEVFAIACKDIANLKSKEKFAAWLAGICRNTAKQMLRVQSKKNSPDIRDNSPDANTYQEMINEAVRQLRPTERELITLRYYDNLPYEKIASVLGISTQAVHGRLTRAKRKIAEYLKRNGVTGDDYE